MEQETKKQVGYIESVELFADTMEERFLKGTQYSLIILASNEEGTLVVSKGDHVTRLESMTNAIEQYPSFFSLIKAALSVLALGEIKK